MKNKGTKQKSKKKGSENAFGCDLTEHLQSSGQEVPQVLKKCAEFIEKHGIVDGIYRLSGVTSNIQRLRQEFCSEACPDLTKEVYLQDIHCVGSLCKLYFRELPNPLLTYELYHDFTEAVSVHGDHEKLLHIQRVIKDLPLGHFRTLEFLTKHLAHLATLSAQTNMHTRNLALVWAPNLLRSKHIEASSGNGDIAFKEVRVQQSVVEFILNHTEQLFSGESLQIKPKEGPNLMCSEKYATLPISGQCAPMKLMSLEEAQARSLSPNHPVHRERQRENSLPDTSTAMLYHTVIDVSDSKRKLSGKSKKWKSIFNLGRSIDTKGKLSRNGSVFIRARGVMEKAALRPSRSMESLCSLPTDDDRTGDSSPAGGPRSIFVPEVKSRTLGSDSLFDISEQEHNWEIKGIKSDGATGAWSTNTNQKDSPGASVTPQKSLPEQLKVFKGDDFSSYQPTSPKNRRMLYSGSSNSSRPSFPGSLFPLESSPRHQRRAVNISEPFAVSVPLRVSAVISSNSTPCRGHVKDKPAAAALKPSKESSEQSSNSGKSNTFPQQEPRKQEEAERKNTEAPSPAAVREEDAGREMSQEGQGAKSVSEPDQPSLAKASEVNETAPSPGKQLHTQNITMQLGKELSFGNDLWPDLHQELKITEPELDLLDETFKPVFCSKLPCEDTKLTADVKSKRSHSSPSLTLLCREQVSNTSHQRGRLISTGSDFGKKQSSESDILFSLHDNFDLHFGDIVKYPHSKKTLEEKEKLHPNITPLTKDDSTDTKHLEPPSLDQVNNPVMNDGPTVTDALSSRDTIKKSDQHENPQKEKNISSVGTKKSVSVEMEAIQRLSVCLEERHNTPEPANDDDDECGRNLEELDLVEPWEELSSTKQWVTSPLHSPEVEELTDHMSLPCAVEEPLTSEKTRISCPFDNGKQTSKASVLNSAELFSGDVPQTSTTKSDPKWMCAPSLPTRIKMTSNNGAQPHPGKQKNAVSSQRIYRQMSHEAAVSEKKQDHGFPKHRPYSLNLDFGHRCIRDISNQQTHNSSDLASCQRGLLTSSGNVNNGLPSELELFLSDRQAPLRRNSAPVSVSSVRTAFMIKTCQAKAVPVVPPKVQYSQIPQFDIVTEREKEYPKTNTTKGNTTPELMSDLKEELENKEPTSKCQTHPMVQKPAEPLKNPELSVITRKNAPSLDVITDCQRPNRSSVLQRPSFRNRQRPQSLILLSPPFPIMDYPHSGDDSKLLPSIKSLNDTSAGSVFSKDMPDGIRTAEGTPPNKMTIPKSGQRLETSTSCFYQPQRRSMIFDSKSHRQIE